MPKACEGRKPVKGKRKPVMLVAAVVEEGRGHLVEAAGGEESAGDDEPGGDGGETDRDMCEREQCER